MGSCIAYPFRMFDSLSIYSTLVPQSSVSFSFLSPWLINSACCVFTSIFWSRACFSGGFITVCQCGLAVHFQDFFFFFLRTLHGLSLVFFNSAQGALSPLPTRSTHYCEFLIFPLSHVVLLKGDAYFSFFIFYQHPYTRRVFWLCPFLLGCVFLLSYLAPK